MPLNLCDLYPGSWKERKSVKGTHLLSAKPWSPCESHLAGGKAGRTLFPMPSARPKSPGGPDSAEGSPLLACSAFRLPRQTQVQSSPWFLFWRATPRSDQGLLLALSAGFISDNAWGGHMGWVGCELVKQAPCCPIALIPLVFTGAPLHSPLALGQPEVGTAEDQRLEAKGQ